MLIDKNIKNIYQNIDDCGSIAVDGVALTADAVFTLADNSELGAKALAYFPDFDFVLNEAGELIDIVAVEHIATAEELRSRYEALVVAKIRESYSQTDENKVIREALASGDYTEFDLYNAYVEQCKASARLEVYGE